MTAPAETSVDPLAAFLHARLDEDEAIARRPRGQAFASWNRSWDTAPQRDLAVDGERVAALPLDLDEHIARHDPARVLADVAARRRIIAAHPLVPARDVWGQETGGTSCGTCDAEPDLMLGGIEQPRTDGCVTLRALAAPYAGHPDYDERWTL